MRQVDGLCDDIDDSGPSDLETRVITARVTSVSRDAVYIDEETYFSLDIASEGFTPYKGDWIDVEYCVLSGTSNIKALSMKPLFYRHLEEVQVLPDNIDDLELSYLETRVIKACVTAVSANTVYIDEEIYFSLDIVSEGDTNLKTTQGVVTSICSDYGLIDQSIYFSCDVVTGNIPLKVGQKVTAVLEEGETSHELKVIKVDVLSEDIDDSGPSDVGTRLTTARVTSVSADIVCIDEETYFSLDVVSEDFKPYKGDWVEVEYLSLPGPCNIKVHSAKPLFCRCLEELSSLIDVEKCSCKGAAGCVPRHHSGDKGTMLRFLRWAMDFFQWRADPVQEQHPQQGALLQGFTNLKTKRGVLTNIYSNYGLINKSIYFTYDVVTSDTPLKVGQKVMVVLEEEETAFELKAIKVDVLCDGMEDSGLSDFGTRVITGCVTSVSRDAVYVDEKTSFSLDSVSEAFMPYKGDWIEVEYSIVPGAKNIKVHSAKPLFCRHLEEVCITSLHGRNGVVNGIIFFTLDSLELPDGYKPQKHDIVNVDAVESVQSCYIWRAVSMTPVQNSL
ncbi:hypothetical protein TREES_T100012430 [Tupaia chinensis]|uniref:S1-like RNA binding domain-containing protein n=1 Tax=Tupaia chinensis TaxID=246437 RepID=L9JD93_TUPCH|nr:hypothetical protein TREES_T100012430 [Tupaia chinensis]